jgi:sporulation protein YlmC with PRC-barrel domain
VKARIATILVLGALAAPPVAGTATLAQSRGSDPPTIDTSRMIGSPVFNGASQKIGTLQDVLIRPSDGQTRLVLAVGNFLGHDKLIAVPVSRVVVQNDRLTMIDATREALEKLPAFSYRSRSG